MVAASVADAGSRRHVLPGVDAGSLSGCASANDLTAGEVTASVPVLYQNESYGPGTPAGSGTDTP